jgi:hypothetical protein
MLQQAGFADVELAGETGFNASLKTKGILVRARKFEKLDAWKDKKKPVETKDEIKQKPEEVKSDSG